MTAGGQQGPIDRRFSVAPMMACTDRHCRNFLRVISGRALLYSEMVTADALIHGDTARLLAFEEAEHPVALQLGGSDPAGLAKAAELGAERGYDEINLNVGCPSDRVRSGRFGACLMAEPERVAACIDAMIQAVAIPVTVKCRIGIDDQDAEHDLNRFIETVAAAGCSSFIVHARKAWLQGVSPKQNREVPPLDYERVYRLKQTYDGLEIIINGGIETIEQCEAHLAHVDGVMLGRAAYDNPYLLSLVDERLFGDDRPRLERGEILERYLPYVEAELAKGEPLHRMTRHILGLFKGQPGARAFRRTLSEKTRGETSGIGSADRSDHGPGPARRTGGGGRIDFRFSGCTHPLAGAFASDHRSRQKSRAYWLPRSGFPRRRRVRACWTKPGPIPRCRPQGRCGFRSR